MHLCHLCFGRPHPTPSHPCPSCDIVLQTGPQHREPGIRWIYKLGGIAMGKRKKSSRGPQGPRKVRGWQHRSNRVPKAHYRWLIFSQKDPLPTKFTCLFCNHEEAVTVLLDKKGGVGQLDCSVCGQTFQCAINCEFLGARDVVLICTYSGHLCRPLRRR